MRRRFALFGALFAMLAFLAASTMSSSLAGTGGQPDHCKERGWSKSIAGDPTYHVYLNVCWDDLSGGGVKVTNVQERVNDDYWEATAFRCDYVVVYNANGVDKWDATDSTCNIPKSLGYRTFDQLGLKLTQSSTASVILAGWPQIDGAPDPGHITVEVDIP